MENVYAPPRRGMAGHSAPCSECGFDWTLSPDIAVAWVTGAHDDFLAHTATASGRERGPRWTVAETVAHVADDLRQGAERVQAARLADADTDGWYASDELAMARRFAAIPLPVALWSLNDAARSWAEVLRLALEEGVEVHDANGAAHRAADLAIESAHDVQHHLWDIWQILADHADSGSRSGADDLGGYEPASALTEVVDVELETLSPLVRADPLWLAEYLAEDVAEFTSAGAEYGRLAAAERVAAGADPDAKPVRVLDLRARVLAEGVVLVTYTAVQERSRVLRSSVWRRAASGRWEMIHHQGTTVRQVRARRKRSEAAAKVG